MPVQPTATGIISIGGREPWFPPSVSPWITLENLSAIEGVVDAYVTNDGNLEGLEEQIGKARAGRVFLITSVDKLEETKRFVDSNFPRERVLVLAHVTQSSEAFLSEDMAEYAQGILIDTPLEGSKASRILSRTVETITRNLGEGKRVIVNARSHFWSEEFLHDVISEGVYAIAVDMTDVAMASNLVISTERRIMLGRPSR